MNKKSGHNLETIVGRCDYLKNVSKSNLRDGDIVIVKTSNSRYTMRKIEDNLFEVSGGWFDKNNLSPQKLAIRGCTWGGSIIQISIVAACGLCLEFGNNVTTSPILKIFVIRAQGLN
jgi:hypothetical protein